MGDAFAAEIDKPLYPPKPTELPNYVTKSAKIVTKGDDSGNANQATELSNRTKLKPEFASWLAKQQHRNDPVGGLALVAATDPDKFAWEANYNKAALQRALPEWSRS